MNWIWGTSTGAYKTHYYSSECEAPQIFLFVSLSVDLQLTLNLESYPS